MELSVASTACACLIRYKVPLTLRMIEIFIRTSLQNNRDSYGMCGLLWHLHFYINLNLSLDWIRLIFKRTDCRAVNQIPLIKRCDPQIDLHLNAWRSWVETSAAKRQAEMDKGETVTETETETEM